MAVTDPFDYFLERERRRQMQANPPAVAPMNIDLGVRETPAVSNIRPPEYFLNGDDAAQQSRPAIDLQPPREVTKHAPAIGKEIMHRPDLTQPREEADLLYSQNVPPGGESDLLSRYSPGSTDAAPQIDLTQPREAVQPLSDVDRYRAQVTDLQQRNHPNYQDNDQGWKKRLGSILREVVIGMGNAWDQNASIADPTQRLLASAGGGVAGGFAGGFDKRIDERRRQAIDLTQARGNLAEAERQAAFDAQMQDQQAMRENQRQAILERQERSADTLQTRALSDLNKLKYFDPANPAHIALAKKAGVANPEALQGWDDRNPIEKQVAGVTYRLNRSTGAYEPTNLPVDESKTLADYEITMPNGEKRTFKVSQKDAANFATQMHTLGIRLEHQSAENQRDRTFQAKRDAARYDFQVKLAQLKTATERVSFIQKERAAYQSENPDASPSEVEAYINALMEGFDQQ